MLIIFPLEAFQKGEKYLAAENLQDPSNLGAMLRTAKEGEITADHAVMLAKELIAKHLPSQDKGIDLYGYAMLYSERAGADGIARYIVSVYPSAIEDTLPELLGTVSFRPDGSDVVVTLN